jgi:tetratricopeptide (TPR) repeat protein
MGKNKLKFSKILEYILSILLGAFIAYLSLSLAESIDKVDNLIILIICLFVVSLMYFISLMFQIIIHEGGHLIFGLLTGYKLIFFRIGKLTFVNDNDKLKLKSYKVVGTAGQCLMMPPEGTGYNCPYILYNLGGILANAIVSLLLLLIYIIFPLPKLIGIFILCAVICGIYTFLRNGIPMKLKITNDGYNVLSISKDKTSRYCFYTMLKVSGLKYMGMRIKDMPLEWFRLPVDADLNNSMICNLKLVEGTYYHDKKQFSKAKECYNTVVNNLSEVSQNEVKCELLFYEIIDEARPEVIEELYNKKLKKYIKMTSNYISHKRLMYAYNLIVLKDKAKAEKAFQEVERIAKTYPDKSEVSSEMEIIEFLKNQSLVYDTSDL